MPDKISVALALPPDSAVKVQGVVSDAGAGWLTITDTTDQIYAWGPAFSGEAIVSGKTAKSAEKTYIVVERIKRVKRQSPVIYLLVAAVLILIPVIIYYGVTWSIPDFHIADIIGPKDPPVGISDLQRDKLTSYTLELIWHEGSVLCAELRNTGHMVIPKEDLAKIAFTINNITPDWNRTALPDKLMLGKRVDLCLCASIGPGCPESATLFSYDKVGDTYPPISIQVRPFYGDVKIPKQYA